MRYVAIIEAHNGSRTTVHIEAPNDTQAELGIRLAARVVGNDPPRAVYIAPEAESMRVTPDGAVQVPELGRDSGSLDWQTIGRLTQ